MVRHHHETGDLLSASLAGGAARTAPPREAVTLKPTELHPRALSLEQVLGLAPAPLACGRCGGRLDDVDVDTGVCGACEYGLGR
jgi:hypothetical protein